MDFLRGKSSYCQRNWIEPPFAFYATHSDHHARMRKMKFCFLYYSSLCKEMRLIHFDTSCFATSISLPFQIQQLLCYLLAQKVMITFSIGIQHASMQLKPNDLSFHLATREIFFSLCGICCRLL